MAVKIFPTSFAFTFVEEQDANGLRFSFHHMEVNRANAASLDIFVQCLNNVPDPRSKQGVSQPFQTALAIVLIGLLAANAGRQIAQIFRRSRLGMGEADVAATQKKAKNLGIPLIFLDESGFSLSPIQGTTWCEVGKPFVLF